MVPRGIQDVSIKKRRTRKYRRRVTENSDARTNALVRIM